MSLAGAQMLPYFIVIDYCIISRKRPPGYFDHNWPNYEILPMIIVNSIAMINTYLSLSCAVCGGGETKPSCSGPHGLLHIQNIRAERYHLPNTQFFILHLSVIIFN